MRISGNSAAKTANPLIAQIEQRIKRLEKQKERLMEQLTGGQSSSPQTRTAGLEQATVSLGGTKVANTGASSAVSSETGEGKAVAPSAPPVSQSVADLTRSLQSLKAAGGGGGGDDGGGLEALMEKIQLIDTQIMTLRQQINSTRMADDMMDMAVPETEGASGNAVSEMLSAPAADGNGHVDGYV